MNKNRHIVFVANYKIVGKAEILLHVNGRKKKIFFEE